MSHVSGDVVFGEQPAVGPTGPVLPPLNVPPQSLPMSGSNAAAPTPLPSTPGFASPRSNMFGMGVQFFNNPNPQVISLGEKVLVVTRLHPEGTAARAQTIQPGDVIASIDGVPVKDLSIADITARLKGTHLPPGTQPPCSITHWRQIGATMTRESYTLMTSMVERPQGTAPPPLSADRIRSSKRAGDPFSTPGTAPPPFQGFGDATQSNGHHHNCNQHDVPPLPEPINVDPENTRSAAVVKYRYPDKTTDPNYKVPLSHMKNDIDRTAIVRKLQKTGRLDTLTNRELDAVVRKAHGELKAWSKKCFVAACLSILFVPIVIEMHWSFVVERNDDGTLSHVCSAYSEAKQWIEIFLYVGQSTTTLMTLVLLYFIYKFHVTQFTTNLVIRNESGKASFLVSRSFKFMMLEWLVCFVHVPPAVHHCFETRVEFTDELMASYPYQWLNVFILIRLYTIMRYIAFNSRFSTQTARMVLTLYKEPYGGNGLAIKDFIATNSISFFMGAYIVTIVVFGYLLMLAERPGFGAEFGGNYQVTYQTSLWLIWTVVTTIGFGDVFPITPIGRLGCVLASVFGTFISATVVSVFFQLLDFSAPQKKVVFTMDTLQSRAVLPDAAARVIETWWRSIKHPTYTTENAFLRALQAWKSAVADSIRKKEIPSEPSDVGLQVKELQMAVDDLAALSMSSVANQRDWNAVMFSQLADLHNSSRVTRGNIKALRKAVATGTGGGTRALMPAQQQQVLSGNDLRGQQEWDMSRVPTNADPDDVADDSFFSSDEEMESGSDDSDSENMNLNPGQIDFLKAVRVTGARGRRGGVSAVASVVATRFVVKTFAKSQAEETRLMSWLRMHPLFEGVPLSAIDKIVQAMSMAEYHKGHELVEAGSECDAMYIVDTGEVTRADMAPSEGMGEGFRRLSIAHSSARRLSGADQRRLSSTGQIPRVTIGRGECINDAALMYPHQCPHAFWVTKPGVIWKITREQYQSVVIARAQERRVELLKFLRNVPIFTHMTNEELGSVADAIKSRTYIKGEKIITQGHIGDSFFILMHGFAYAQKPLSKGRHPTIVKRYQKGDFFGELALLEDQPRAADVIAQTEGVLAAMLSRSAFRRILGNAEGTIDKLKAAAQNYIGYKGKAPPASAPAPAHAPASRGVAIPQVAHTPSQFNVGVSGTNQWQTTTSPAQPSPLPAPRQMMSAAPADIKRSDNNVQATMQPPSGRVFTIPPSVVEPAVEPLSLPYVPSYLSSRAIGSPSEPSYVSHRPIGITAGDVPVHAVGTPSRVSMSDSVPVGSRFTSDRLPASFAHMKDQLDSSTIYL